MINNKMCKTAKTLDIIAKIAQIISAVGIVASLVAAVIMGVGLMFDLPAEMLGETGFTISLDSYVLTLSDDIPLLIEKTFSVGIAAMFTMAAHMGIIYYFIKVLRAIFAPMKEGKPFHDSVALNLKKLGFCGIALCVMDAISSFVGGVMTTTVYPLQEMLGDAVTHVSYETHINMSYLFLACLCFLLSYIFSYGTQLQIQSDETL